MPVANAALVIVNATVDLSSLDLCDSIRTSFLDLVSDISISGFLRFAAVGLRAVGASAAADRPGWPSFLPEPVTSSFIGGGGDRDATPPSPRKSI